MPWSIWRRLARIRLTVALVACVGAGPFGGRDALMAAPPASEVRVERAYPTGDRNTSVILLERLDPSEVRLGDEMSYRIRLTNISRGPVDEIVLAEQPPSGMRVNSMSPNPARQEGGRSVWEFKRLEPGRSETVQVFGKADATGKLSGCATVTFNTNICSNIPVVEPKLALTKSLPPSAVLCDEIPMRITVTNTGSGAARAVRLSDSLPRGLITTDNREAFAVDLGDLQAGQSREVLVRLKATQTGEFNNTARATEEGGLSAEGSATVVVRKPELSLTKTCPDVRFLGRPADFELTLRNTGDAPATDVVLTDNVPAGLNFVTADNGGQFSGGVVTWRLGTIEPGASRSVRLSVNCRERGVFENTAAARAYCADARASCRMEVKGIAAILLEVIDVHDPIEIGADETYEIEVLNQGSTEGTNIRVVAELPPEMRFVSASGPTRERVSGRTIEFDPIPSLAPKAKAVYRVIARGEQAGDVRFKVSITSDQITSPVQETESTHVY